MVSVPDGTSPAGWSTQRQGNRRQCGNRNQEERQADIKMKHRQPSLCAADIVVTSLGLPTLAGYPSQRTSRCRLIFQPN